LQVAGGERPGEDVTGRAGGLWLPVVVAVGVQTREVEVVAVAAAGKSDVEVFAVDAGSGEEECVVDGGALGAVDGGCPPVSGVAGDVFGGEHSRGVAVEGLDV
jgi:hypothetical protein